MSTVVAPPPAPPRAPRRKRRPVGRIVAAALLLLVIAAVALSPVVRVAPASVYLLAADLPGVPLGPLPVLLGSPTPNEWSFQGAEGTINADVYRPVGGGVHPTILVVNGALAAGRKYPALAQFGRALAQAGYTAVIPDYPDLLREELSPASLADVETTLRRAAAIPGVDPRRLELVGFCVGGTLSLLTAENANLPPERAVVDLAGFASAADMLQVITTDTYPYRGQTFPYATDPWVVVAVARSLVASLPDAADRAVFAPFLKDPPPDHYVAPDWSKVPANRLSPAGQAVLALLRNRDPARVASLIAALPTGMRQQLTRMSPLNGIAQLRSPVFIVADRSDTYIPNVESEKLVDARPALVHMRYVSLLAHVEPELAAQSNPLATAWDFASGGWQFFLAIDQALTALQ